MHHPPAPTVGVVLGASNDERGVLRAAGVGRCEAALEEYRARRGHKLILTGGRGAHFNVTDVPHASYVHAYLTERGVAESDILGWVLSANTVQDALFTRELLASLGEAPAEIRVVTSWFHAERARLIFAHVFPSMPLHVVEAPAWISPEEEARACAHERGALHQIRAQGGILLPTSPAGSSGEGIRWMRPGIREGGAPAKPSAQARSVLAATSPSSASRR